jgi:hypothetical protein
MIKNTSYETTVKENLESYEDIELIRKIKSGDLTEVAEKIAMSIIKDRNINKGDDYLTEIKNTAEIENEEIKTKNSNIYRKLKLMNAIGTILWGFGLVLISLFLLFSIFSEKYESFNFLFGFFIQGFFLLSPFYTWKVCHSEKYRNLTSTAFGLNFANIALIFLIGFLVITFNIKYLGSVMGIAVWVVIPSLINLIFLPKYEEASTNNI